MPPRAKYSKEEIIEIAFQMARENGLESVVARELGKKLGTSSSPIFTAFKNMDELHAEIRKKAMKEFESYVKDALNYTPAFKQVGVKMIQFAFNEPKLFKILYMQEHGQYQTFDDLVGELGDTVDVCLKCIQEDYALSMAEAKILFQQVWLHTFGIGVLVAGKVCQLSEEQISEMLSLEFQGTLMLIKSGKFKTVPISGM